MYLIYNGAMACLPEKEDKILYRGKDNNYMDGLKEIGYNTDKIYYTRGCMDESGIQYLDVGSWSIFIALGNEEQLGKYFKEEK